MRVFYAVDGPRDDRPFCNAVYAVDDEAGLLHDYRTGRDVTSPIERAGVKHPPQTAPDQVSDLMSQEG